MIQPLQTQARSMQYNRHRKTIHIGLILRKMRRHAMVCSQYKNRTLIPRLFLHQIKKLTQSQIGIAYALMQRQSSFRKNPLVFFGHPKRMMRRNRKNGRNKGLGKSPKLFPKKLEKRRSEEHTSELQSRPQLVCRLLLEKKKK